MFVIFASSSTRSFRSEISYRDSSNSSLPIPLAAAAAADVAMIVDGASGVAITPGCEKRPSAGDRLGGSARSRDCHGPLNGLTDEVTDALPAAAAAVTAAPKEARVGVRSGDDRSRSVFVGIP